MMWCWRAVLLARSLFLSDIAKPSCVTLGALVRGYKLRAFAARGARARAGESRDRMGGPGCRVRPDEVYFHNIFTDIIHPHASPRQVHDVHYASTPL